MIGFLLDVAAQPLRRLWCELVDHDTLGPWVHQGHVLKACRRCRKTWGRWP